MTPRLNVITLAVNDLEQSLAFYRDGLGLPTKGIVATQYLGTETEPAGAVVFFELLGGLLLALYPRSELAKDARVPETAPNSLEFSLASIVASRQEVDDVLRQAEAAGATITDQPHDRAWGIYSGYFKDPDGHLWEIIWKPATGSGT
jgi:catechol 2,3-dioxygenase-like lactoylglutathione lyase family enzyme